MDALIGIDYLDLIITALAVIAAALLLGAVLVLRTVKQLPKLEKVAPGHSLIGKLL